MKIQSIEKDYEPFKMNNGGTLYSKGVKLDNGEWAKINTFTEKLQVVAGAEFIAGQNCDRIKEEITPCDSITKIVYESTLNSIEKITEKDIKQLEDHVPLNKTTEAINFELDDYHMQRLKELGLDGDKKDDDDPYNLVSYK